MQTNKLLRASQIHKGTPNHVNNSNKHNTSTPRNTNALRTTVRGGGWSPDEMPQTMQLLLGGQRNNTWQYKGESKI